MVTDFLSMPQFFYYLHYSIKSKESINLSALFVQILINVFVNSVGKLESLFLIFSLFVFTMLPRCNLLAKKVLGGSALHSA